MKAKLRGRHPLSLVMTIQPSSNLIRWLQSAIVLFFFLVNFTPKKQHQQWLYSLGFYGWTPYPLIKSLFICACQTFMFYLFSIPFVSDLKWNHIWGNSKRGVLILFIHERPMYYKWKSQFSKAQAVTQTTIWAWKVLWITFWCEIKTKMDCAQKKEEEEMEQLKSYEALWSRIDFWDTTDTSEHSHQVRRFSKSSPVLLTHYTKQNKMNT